MKQKAQNHWKAELERVKASSEIPVPAEGEWMRKISFYFKIVDFFLQSLFYKIKIKYYI